MPPHPSRRTWACALALGLPLSLQVGLAGDRIGFAEEFDTLESWSIMEADRPLRDLKIVDGRAVLQTWVGSIGDTRPAGQPRSLGVCLLLVFAVSGAAAPGLRARAEAYRPYDGSGRYTMEKDDGVRGTQGLATLAARRGTKPYQELSSGTGQWLTWQTERVFFRDVETQAPMARLTCDPFTDQLSYFQGNWSADGSTIVWRRRPGMWEGSTPTHGPMAMKADGTGLRNVFRDYGMARGEVCSPAAPGVCYASVNADSKVVAFDLESGKTRHVVRESVPRGWHMKISPDGRYLMNRADTSKGKGIWICSVDGKELHEIAIPEAIHDSYHFHPTQRKILFWYEGKFHTEGFWQCGFDGEGRTNYPVRFDWNHGDFGLDRGVHTTGGMTRMDEAGGWRPLEPLFHAPGVEYYDDPHDYNGYSSWQPKDRPWAYHTRILRRPWISELLAAATEPAPDHVVNRFRICFTGLMRGRDLDAPGASPDGTKVLFNSNMLGQQAIYCVTARLPESPRGLALQEAPGGGGRLTWQAPPHHAEIAGYHLYRSAQDGRDFVPVTAQPVTERAFTVAADAACYAVTAVEHSGLESGLSATVGVGMPAGLDLHLEAEEARLSPEMWLAYQGLANGLHYIWMRAKSGSGRGALPLERELAAGTRVVWARVKGLSGASFTFAAGGAAVALQAPASSQWKWVRAAAPLAVAAGARSLELTSDLYGSAIDSIVLTDDARESPETAPRIVWPPLPAVAGLRAEALSPYEARLTWEAVNGATFRHYNLYRGDQPGFTPGQETLVASPDKPPFVDWGLKPGTAVHYRITAVDRAGNESAPSAGVSLGTPPIKAFTVDKPFAAALDFEVPADDTYVVWLRLEEAAGARGGYLNVKVDGTGGGSWMARLDGAADVEWFTYEGWGRFALATGTHKLTVDNKSGYAIDRVLITNDQSLAPPGRVAVLTGW